MRKGRSKETLSDEAAVAARLESISRLEQSRQERQDGQRKIYRLFPNYGRRLERRLSEDIRQADWGGVVTSR